MTIKDGVIYESESINLDFSPLDIQLSFDGNTISIKNGMTSDDINNHFNNIDNKNIYSFYSLYHGSDNQGYILEYLQNFIKLNDLHVLSSNGGFQLRRIFFNYVSHYERDHNYKPLNIVKMLLMAGLDPSISFPRGYDALPFNLFKSVIETGDYEFIKYMLKLGVQIPDGSLIICLKGNRYDIADLLLKNGANINEYGNISDRIIMPGDLYPEPEMGGLLHYAIKKENMTLVKYLLEKNVSINIDFIVNSQGDTINRKENFNSTGYAVLIGNTEILKILLENGADEPKGSKTISTWNNYVISQELDKSRGFLSNEDNRNLKEQNIMVYSKNGKYYKHTVSKGLYTLAKEAQRLDILEYLDGIDFTPHSINMIEEIKF